MRILNAALLCLVALAPAASAQAQAAPFALRDGDRVVFYGDSITDQRLYSTFAETFVVTRFPKLNITFVHSGWGGDRVNGGGGGPIDVRLWRDVFPYNPTVMTIMLGMNDGRYRPFEQPVFDEFATGYKHIVSTMKRQFPGIRITAIQPSPFDDVTQKPRFEGGYNQTLLRYSDFLKELAGTEKLWLADLNTPVVAMLEKAKAADAVNAAKIIPDQVHPAAGGHLIMAAALVKSWDAPAVVSAVELDVNRKDPVRQVNTQVSEFRTGNLIRWTQTDEALPMPVNMRDPLVALAVRSSDFVQTLNQQPLKVTGLGPGRSYALLIDGESAGTFTAAQLAAGINLAELNTPMTRQAAEVHALTLQHNNVHAIRWRQIQVPMEKGPTPHLASTLAALDEFEGDLIARQRAAALPKPHQFELRPE